MSATLLSFFVLLSFIVITCIKKKKQIGKTWSGRVTARVHIAGKPLSCQHCGNTQFQKREGILVTSLVCLFRFDYWNQSAACYTCIQCGCVHWFVRPTEEKVEITIGPHLDE